jgi:hypothetical protein
VATLDLPVLLRPPRSDVAAGDPGFLDGELEREKGKLVAVVGLNPADREWERGLSWRKKSMLFRWFNRRQGQSWVRVAS